MQGLSGGWRWAGRKSRVGACPGMPLVLAVDCTSSPASLPISPTPRGAGAVLRPPLPPPPPPPAPACTAPASPCRPQPPPPPPPPQRALRPPHGPQGPAAGTPLLRASRTFQERCASPRAILTPIALTVEKGGRARPDCSAARNASCDGGAAEAGPASSPQPAALRLLGSPDTARWAGAQACHRPVASPRATPERHLQIAQGSFPAARPG